MTPRERAAYNAGIEAMRQAAMIAAFTIEAGAGGRETRHRAAAAALQGLAEGAQDPMLGVGSEAAHGLTAGAQP